MQRGLDLFKNCKLANLEVFSIKISCHEKTFVSKIVRDGCQGRKIIINQTNLYKFREMLFLDFFWSIGVGQIYLYNIDEKKVLHLKLSGTENNYQSNKSVQIS